MKMKSLLGAGVLGAVGLLSPLTALATHAHSAPCRSDPILALSNGKTLQVTASINDAQSDVSKVLYTVNLPAGVSVKKITYTTGWKTNVEQVQVNSTEPSNTYVTTTSVTTASGSYAFTATDNLMSGTTTLATGSASGTTKTNNGTVAGRSATDTLVG